MRIGSLGAWTDRWYRVRAQLIRRARHALGLEVDRGVGVGQDESRFGGGQARTWFEFVEDRKEGVARFFEHSRFDRLPWIGRWVRKLLALPARHLPRAPTQPVVLNPPPSALGRPRPTRSASGLMRQVQAARHRSSLMVDVNRSRARDDDPVRAPSNPKTR